MVCLTLRPYLPDGGIESEKSTMADGFVQVLERLELEYDLPPDIWAVAEDVLQALKARETNSDSIERPRSQSEASVESVTGQ
jgi:hypothetical protein